MLDRCKRASRAGHSRVSLVVSLAIVCLLLACGLAFAADATIGLYQDEFGNSCTFNNAPGFVTVYVVVKPATGGTRAVEFAAPIPSCFHATYIGESVPFLVLGTGNSQTGISLAARDCQTEPFSVLSILYMTSAGTTPCCPYPILADPAVGDVQAVDCSFNYQPITTNVARFNADASCPCGADLPPVPNNPTPVDFAVDQPTNQQLSWQVPSSQQCTYDVYFGTSTTPPQVAFGQTAQTYDPGLLAQGTTYRWQIVTKRSGASYPGPVWTFTTAGSGPETPNTPDPASGAINVSTNPTLTWLSTGVKFDVYFGTQNPPPLVLSNYTTHFFGAGALASNTPYFWRIVAKDNFGSIYPGASWGFTTGNGGPLPPTSPSPADGASGVSQTPTLSWQEANHPQGLGILFDVYLGTTTPLPKVASNLDVRSFQPGNLGAGTFQWYVVARDTQNREASSAIWSFATTGAGNSPPSTPSNPVPPDNSTIASTSPTFSWSSSDPDTPQLSYAIALGRSPDVFSTLVGFGSPNVPHYNFGFLQTGRYYWIVSASDGTSTVTGPIWTFDLTLPLAVAFKHFDATSSRGAVDVRWELASDEPMSGFVLYRRDGASLQSRIVAQGALTDATGSYLDTSVDAGKTYRYELLVRTASGDEMRSAIATVSLPELGLALYQNQPNPFNPETTIRYDLPGSASVRVRLLIMDLAGHRVRVLVDETQSGGTRSVAWNGRDDNGNAVSSGVYFYVLDAGKERLTRKLVLLK